MSKIQEKGHIGNYKIVNEEMTKDEQCSSSSKRQKRAECCGCRQWLDFFIFSERGSGFSLGFRPIEPSVFDGARRKVALRNKDYA